MKNLFASLLVALTIGTSSATFAAANPTHDPEQIGPVLPAGVSIAQIEKSTLDVVVENEGAASMSIRLLDSSGRSLAAKTLPQKEEATRVRFDLADLKDGVYLVKVSDGKNTQVTKFELKTTVPTPATYQNLTIL
jgi:hypothetical protein